MKCLVDGCNSEHIHARNLCCKHYTYWHRGQGSWRSLPIPPAQKGRTWDLNIDMSRLSDFELGWLVGILEGEGSFDGRGGGTRIKLHMTDKDTVTRYSEMLIRISNRTHRNRVTEINKKYPLSNIFACVADGPMARPLLRQIVKHFSNRRRGQIWRALNGYTQSSKSKLSIKEVVQCVKAERIEMLAKAENESPELGL